MFTTSVRYAWTRVPFGVALPFWRYAMFFVAVRTTCVPFEIFKPIEATPSSWKDALRTYFGLFLSAMRIISLTILQFPSIE